MYKIALCLSIFLCKILEKNHFIFFIFLIILFLETIFICKINILRTFPELRVICLSLDLSNYLSIYVIIYPSIYVIIYLSIYWSIYLFIYLMTNYSIYLSIYLITDNSAYLSIYLSTRIIPYTCLSIYLITDNSIYLSIFPCRWYPRRYKKTKKSDHPVYYENWMDNGSKRHLEPKRQIISRPCFGVGAFTPQCNYTSKKAFIRLCCEILLLVNIANSL